VLRLLHPDVEFTTPRENIQGAQEYISALPRLGPILLRNEMKKSFVDGNEVCIIYDFLTDTAVGAVPSVEWVTVEVGRLRQVWLLFHSQPWPAVLEEVARRTKPIS
jgi:hypothetical protein